MPRRTRKDQARERVAAIVTKGSKAWRMPEPCLDCPFNRTGPGARLRRTLRPARWAEITRLVGTGQSHFMCHKTTPETGNGTNLYCAGALAYQDKLGVSDNYRRVCERLEGR
jgi:hypothetical protein